MIIIDKSYITLKIKNCKNLIENATSDDQIEIYEGYLLFWRKKLTPIVKKIDSKNDEIYDDRDYATEFEIENPLRKAYYKRDGKLIKTKRFKEYLKSNKF
ncbi:hypothetical protein LCGC14_1413260 [marine sediment metagenome]|uniref:Uncharacterized protein n=1 Tax=marine sediment metagenome TaxID=412755 RepID=A0A0F9JTY6_9ZZZZ